MGWFKIKCPECNSSSILLKQELGETICRKCGLVVESGGFEINPYTDRKPMSISSPISAGTYRGKYALTNFEKTMVKGMRMLRLIDNQLNLPRYIKQDAKRYFKTSIHKNILIGRSLNTMMFACVNLALKKAGNTTNVEDILHHFSIKPKSFRRSCKLLKGQLNVKLELVENVDLVFKHCSKLKISEKAKTYAVDMITKVEKDFIGKNPKGVIGAVIYFTSKKFNEKIPLRKIADSLNIAETTLRKRHQELARFTTVG